MADWYFRGFPGRDSGGGAIGCPGCRKLVGRDEEFCPYCARRLRPEKGWRVHWRRLQTMPYPATTLLIGLLVLVFLLQYAVGPGIGRKLAGAAGVTLSDRGVARITYYLMGASSAKWTLEEGGYWRLVGYVFLHAGLIHIFFNGWMLRDLGRLAEKIRRSREVFATFILTGLAGGLASALYHGWAGNPDVPSIGASGAVCGLLGLLLGFEYRRYGRGRNLRLLLSSNLGRSCLYILAFGLIVEAVDNAAHVGGLAAGIGLGFHLPPGGKAWSAAAGLSLAFLAIAAVKMGLNLARFLW
ncbi:MAG: rhomboid family intramembrane serine protease [Planctomycetota bacterium]|jgi:rhomboid protease GluP|nr:rhomboid family intramembrane serine protease [Planctomycetota bacterium]